MDADRFRKVADLFERARVLRPAAREVFLRHACSDTTIRTEVESLLSQHDEAESQVQETLLSAGDSLRRDAEAPLAADVRDLEETAMPEYIGRYRVKEEIARGGAGVVLRAVDESIGRDVALKVLRSRGPHRNQALARRLLEEGRISGRMQHPGLVPVYEVDHFDGDEPYLVMKVVEGRTFGELLASRKDLEDGRNRLLGILAQACEAVAYAHAKGVIHRDLKPQNLMVGEFGEMQVMDWGLAKVLVEGDDQPATALTKPGSVMGTPSYMAPEQALGNPDGLDARTDVFGLGAILCEVLTGQPPYTGDSNRRILKMARHADTAEALQRLQACGAGEEVVELATRCLAGGRDQRPKDAGEVAKGLRSYLESLDNRARNAEMHAATAQARVSAERRARKLTAALLVGALLTAGIGGTAWGWIQSEAEDSALAEQRRDLAALRSVRESLLGRIADAEERIATARNSDLGLAAWRAAKAETDAANVDLQQSGQTDLVERGQALLIEATGGLRQAELADNLKDLLANCRGLDGWGRTPPPGAFAAELADFCGADPMQMDATGLTDTLGQALPLETVVRTMDRWLAAVELHRAEVGLRSRLRQAVANLDPDPQRAAIRSSIAVDNSATGTLRLLRNHAKEANQLSAGAAILLGNALAMRGDFSTAARVLTTALRNHPQDLDLLHLASRALQAIDPSQAVAAAMAVQALALEPERPWPTVALVQALSAAGQHQQAVATGRAMVAREPGNLVAQIALGQSLIQAGEFSAANTELSRAIRNAYPGLPLYPVAAALRGSARLAPPADGSGMSPQAMLPAFRDFHDAVAATHSLVMDPVWQLPEGLSRTNMLQALDLLGQTGGSQAADPNIVKLLRARVLLATGDPAAAEELFADLLEQLPARLAVSEWVQRARDRRRD